MIHLFINYKTFVEKSKIIYGMVFEVSKYYLLGENMKIGKNKVRRLLLVLVLVLLISFVSGILFVGVLNGDSKKIIIDSISNYFSNFNNNGISVKSCFNQFLVDALLYIFVSIMGISIVGWGVSLIVFTFKSFLAGFLFCSIIYTYGFKGILLSIVYMVPEFISLFLCFMICYYAISFSVILYKYVFRKNEYNIKNIMAKYLRVVLISLGGVLLNSIIRVLVSYIVLRLFNF